MKKILIWLDDMRDPTTGTWIQDFSPIVADEIIWLKDADQFKNWVTTHGLPTGICFDHDLGDGESGFDCAKFLVDYCLDHDIKTFPVWNVQSSNPVGKDNINGILKGFIKFIG